MAFVFKNDVTIVGTLYEHRLAERVTGEGSKNPGTKFIGGDVILETAENNLITVSFPYVVEFGKDGTTPNQTFTALRDIINGVTASKMGGSPNPARLRITRSALATNDYFDARNTKEVVTSPHLINRGGYIYPAGPADANKAEFDTDILIYSVTIDEHDDPKAAPSATIKGYVFGYNGTINPGTFTVDHPGAIDYFTSQDISPSNMFFTNVKGEEVNKRVQTTVTQEGAFSTSVSTATRNERKLVINWAKPEPHLYNDENTIDDAFVQKALSDREVMKSDLKNRGMNRLKNASPVANMPSNMPGAFPAPNAAPADGVPAWAPPTTATWSAPVTGQPTAVPAWSTAAPNTNAPSWSVTNM